MCKLVYYLQVANSPRLARFHSGFFKEQNMKGFSTIEMSTMLSGHHGVLYLVQRSHACDPKNMSIGLKVKPNETDKKEEP